MLTDCALSMLDSCMGRGEGKRALLPLLLLLLLASVTLSEKVGTSSSDQGAELQAAGDGSWKASTGEQG